MSLPICTYAGISLPLITPEVEASIAEHVGADLVPEFDTHLFPQLAVQNLPVMVEPDRLPLRFGVLYWPRDASRFATYHSLVNKPKLDEIRAAIGSSNQAKNLVLGDSRRGKTITASMWMLPPRPIAQNVDSTEDVYLLTLVDNRYYLRWKTGSITSKPASWTSLFSSLASALGITLTPDSVYSAYQSPSRFWIQYYQPLVYLLDAAARTIGHRIIFNLDGTAQTQRYSTATTVDSGLFDAAQSTLGGDIQTEDIRRYVPASVSVAFAKWTAVPAEFYDDPDPEFYERNGVKYTRDPDPYIVTKTLASLSLSDYGNSTGVSGTVATVHADFSYDGTNATACANLATQAATDWYGWQLATTDVIVPGIEPWTPNAYDDAVEWTFSISPEPKATTRIVRGPWFRWTPGTWTGEPPEFTTTTTTTSGCSGTCVFNYTASTSTWSKDSSTCSTGCKCMAPKFCPSVDTCGYSTPCIPIAADELLPACGTTTTGGCCLNNTCTIYHLPTGFVRIVSNDCNSPCKCPVTAVSNGAVGGDPTIYCENETLDCIPPPFRGCGGTCGFIWYPAQNGQDGFWALAQSCDSGPYVPNGFDGVFTCVCTGPPTSPGTVCGEARVFPCYATDPPDPCSGLPPTHCPTSTCIQQGDGSGGWIVIRGCPTGCACTAATRASLSSCDTIETPCGANTTTTTAGPTTTTTPSPDYYCIYVTDGSGTGGCPAIGSYCLQGSYVCGPPGTACINRCNPTDHSGSSAYSYYVVSGPYTGSGACATPCSAYTTTTPGCGSCACIGWVTSNDLDSPGVYANVVDNIACKQVSLIQNCVSCPSCTGGPITLLEASPRTLGQYVTVQDTCGPVNTTTTTAGPTTTTSTTTTSSASWFCWTSGGGIVHACCQTMPVGATQDPGGPYSDNTCGGNCFPACT